MSTYLDCNATTPIEPSVRDLILRFMSEDFGNAGSRTHDFGARAKQAVERARDQVASVVAAKRDEVIFTSGATEANNLAVLGLADHARREGRRHVITSAIEHKAVLEPIEYLEKDGFEVTRLRPAMGGWVDPEAVVKALRPDTVLVSLMHVNNETGVEQPLGDIAQALKGHPTYFHVDAAQGFGKSVGPLRDPRVDLISVSAHKIFGPKGVGALITRRRGFERVPLKPLTFGGGQERGLRPGTLPVPLIAGFGLAAEMAVTNLKARRAACLLFRERLLQTLAPMRPTIHGDQDHCVPHTLSVAFEGVDSEALMVAWKGLVAISNGAACTSHEYQLSHVLQAMGLPESIVRSTVRLSWCHLTEDPDWGAIGAAVRRLRS
jgi:cysteine desulfurase